MIIANKYEIPDTCPDACPGKEGSFYQGNMCYRCPVLNCKTIKDECGYDFCLVDPKDFNPNLAEEWEIFFKPITTNF